MDAIFLLLCILNLLSSNLSSFKVFQTGFRTAVRKDAFHFYFHYICTFCYFFETL